ncbi:MAG TPA: efflux RND transporter permease subunit [Candidatus Ozemobacteraceae bacterium]|nr:efflux RND transporter permease subunit [Candidatus Ozemobacteraceae bacterium]
MSSHLNATPQEETGFRTALPRFFVRSRQVAWVLLLAVLLWGVYGYVGMPQRKDPEIPVHLAVAITAWPGASAENIEQLVTKRIETKVAENAWVETIESTSRTNVSIVFVTLDKRLAETGKEFDDIALKLNSLSLPAGAGPITFIKDFGDTSALMLTVASPLVDEKEIEVRARFLKDEILACRAGASSTERVTAVVCLPHFPVRDFLDRPIRLFERFLEENALATGIRTFETAGMVGADFASPLPDGELERLIGTFLKNDLQWPELSLEAWKPFIVRNPAATRDALAAVAGPKFSYRQLDRMSELIEKSLKTLPQVSKVSRVGLLQEAIYLIFKQERLAAHGLEPADLPPILEARNRLQAGGMLNVADRNLMVEGTGAFQTPGELGDVLLSVGSSGAPLYLRDLFDQFRGYLDPPRFLNYLSKPDARGVWKRLPAVTIAVQMRPGEKIGRFGAAVDGVLEAVRNQLPDELILERTSDQPVQVRENIHLFLKSLIEAVILVVLISWIGFWDGRTALLLAASIPLTLAMTFGMMHLLKIDLQQVSIASLIIALGLLVDVPVVAGDSIKRLLGNGVPAAQACWLGPSRLNKALFFATLTNIVAYLPFLMLTGNVGRFLYSLPVVITCSLIAANIVSLTFVPLLGRSLLRPVPELSVAELRKTPLYAAYGRLMEGAIAWRKTVLCVALCLLIPGILAFSKLPRQFFPKDLSYLSYVDVWLPDDAPLSATDEIAARAEGVIRETAAAWGAAHPGMAGPSGEVLANLTTFVGGGGPRFWFSVSPELQQLNYAQILVEVADKHATRHLVPRLQETLSTRVPGARFDVRQLETGEPVGVPVAVRLFGQDLTELRRQAARLEALMKACPFSDRVRDTWGTPNLTLSLRTLDDRANLSGITHLDVTSAAAFALNGFPLTKYREGDREIPVIARSSMENRSHLSDLENLYVFSLVSNRRQPIGQVADLEYRLKPEKILRRNQFRCVTVSCFPAEGFLPSQVVSWLRPGLASFTASLPLGYRLEVAGEQEKQDKGFRELIVVLGVSVCMIYLALVFQFSHAVKPFIVFGAIPFGMLGAILVLYLEDAPFGFMAFLGVASLIGVIVSHIIVLFDFIEEERERGASLEDALLDAGIMRLRPVMITVAATLIALLPLARHGGPLWEPLCYAQIGGLAMATLVTLLLVPTLYAIFVRDLGLVEWRGSAEPDPEP